MLKGLLTKLLELEPAGSKNGGWEPLLLGRGRPFGERRRDGDIYIPSELSNQNLICVGASGSGKTRLIFSLFAQLVDDREGSIILLDPHGDLSQNALRLIAHKVFGPEKAADLAERLVLIEPTNIRHGCVGLNVLEHEEGRFDYEVVAELISAFHFSWAESFGPRLEDTLRNGCLALQSLGLTLIEMPWILMDGNFRQHAVSQLKDEDVKMYFEKHFPGLSKTDQRYFVESARNKVAAFTSNPYLKWILGQVRSTVRFADVINRCKICIINLSRNHLKTEARMLFGSLLVAKILMAMLSREDIPEGKRKRVTILVDEAHEVFCRDLFLPLFEGGRKYRVRTGGFTQSLSQLDPKDVDIILGNTGVQICFQVGRKDAERVAREFWSFPGRYTKLQDMFYSVQEQTENAISELTNQEVRECYIKLKGAASDPLIATALPVDYPAPNPKWENTLREISARKYNRSLDEVNRELKERRRSLEEAMAGHQHKKADKKAVNKLSSEEELFLRDVHSRPFVLLSERYEDLSARLSRTKANRIKTKLARSGYIEEIPVKTGRQGGQPKLLKITKRGASYLGVHSPNNGKGGFEHQFWQYMIQKAFASKGYKATIEDNIGKDLADVGIEKDSSRIAVEVTLHNENVSKNVSRDLGNGYGEVWVACPDVSTLDKAKRKLREELEDAVAVNRVQFHLLKDLVFENL